MLSTARHLPSETKRRFFGALPLRTTIGGRSRRILRNFQQVFLEIEMTRFFTEVREEVGEFEFALKFPVGIFARDFMIDNILHAQNTVLHARNIDPRLHIVFSLPSASRLSLSSGYNQWVLSIGRET